MDLSYELSKDGVERVFCQVDGNSIEGQSASEILKKFRSASNLVTHNSTAPNLRYMYSGDRFTEVLEAFFTPSDREKISRAEKDLQSKVKKAAKQHKDELEKLLGKLRDKYRVELSTMERTGSARVPLEITLADKTVEIPLAEWGAGTQNRTRVLISVLEAVRVRQSATEQNRSTPVFLVEEPESFLHPSAQAEFGHVLNSLADELKIQIIATTHSPYLLNQKNSKANILLERRMARGAPKETVVIDTDGDNWMRPFAESLGITATDFFDWGSVFAASKDRVLLVEGEIDLEYFSFIKSQYPSIYQLPEDVEIIP